MAWGKVSALLIRKQCRYLPPWCSCCSRGSVALQPRGKRCSGAIPTQQILLCSTWGLILLGAESPGRGSEVCLVPACSQQPGGCCCSKGGSKGQIAEKRGAALYQQGFANKKGLWWFKGGVDARWQLGTPPVSAIPAPPAAFCLRLPCSAIRGAGRGSGVSRSRSFLS